MSTLHQAPSESAVFMLLDVETVETEDVEFLMEYVVAEDVEEEVDEVEEETNKAVMEEAAAHMKMELISQMSPVSLKIQSGPHYQTMQGKGSLMTQDAQSSWKIKRGTPTATSVMKRITRNG